MNELTAEKVNIGGIGISNLYFKEVVEIFNKSIDSNVKKRVCVTPVNCIVWATQNSTLKEIYNSADLTLCDGVPIIWASKLLGSKIRERVTGLDLLPAYIAECYKRNYSMFFLGAQEGVAERLKEKCESLYSGIKISGIYTPPFAKKFTEEENAKMIDLVNDAHPDILWVSLSAPKQDYWINEHFDKLNAKIIIGVGGAFEITAGLIKRAPVILQKSGLEWFYRFYKEPTRLFKRYFVEAPLFLPVVLKQWVKKKKIFK